jgi:tartrate dehydrogenase/decarboxylase/D-malate dehydrogenase
MNPFNIAVLAGDGIGPEVTEEAIRVVDAAAGRDEARFRWTRYPWNSDYYRTHGRMAPADYLDQLRSHDAIFLGAIGDPAIQDHVTLNGLLLPIRREFDQYVCLRPSYLFDGIESPLRGKKAGEIDILVLRENTEGEYANIGGRLYNHTSHEVAVQSALFTRRGCERIMRAAFDWAGRRRGKVTSITKSNAQGYGMVLWDEVFDRVKADFPKIKTESILIDRAAMDFVRRPESFDVVVASNLFGDILTDLAAILVGSMGLAASGNINPERTAPSMFEPVHGSAPDIAGKGIANPLAAILAGAMMLEHLGLSRAARAIHNAVAGVLKAGSPRTPDLAGSATTGEVGEAVLARLQGP